MDRFTLLLLSLLFINGSVFFLLASVLAAEFGDRHIESHNYGYMLCAYSLAASISSFMVPMFIDKFKRSRVVFIGIILTFLSMSC